MDKKDLLTLMRLLSALESWGFSSGNRLPDYLHDDLSRMVTWLEEQILKGADSMSLDFRLSVDGDEVYSRNITHNLNKMAEAAGIYTVLWRPDENGITKAHQCIEPLRTGLLELVAHRAHYEQFNSPNGWGLYKHFVPFVTDVLMACCEHPDADVEVSR